MVPAIFTNFFIASAGAGGALIGLLFVAVSIAPETTIMTSAPVERQASAGSAFTSLLNAFFISLGALIPINLGQIIIIMSLVGFGSTAFYSFNLLRNLKDRHNLFARSLLLLAGLFIYGFEFYIALLMLNKPANPSPFYGLSSLLLAVYGLGLVRAWQLLGAQRYGILSWLNPLRVFEHDKKVEETNHAQPSPVKSVDQE
ncbi:MAG TPA: hypothetical protein VIZ18_06965 [Ktedonobacteraceae bacterium]